MGYISGGELLGHYPLPSVDLLRMSNDLGFALAGVAGSWAAGVAVATLSIQGYTAGVFGTRMRAFGVLTAFALLLAMLFVPIGALFLWALTAAVMSDPAPRANRPRRDGGSPTRRKRRLDEPSQNASFSTSELSDIGRRSADLHDNEAVSEEQASRKKWLPVSPVKR